MEFRDKYLVDNNRLWGAEEMKSFSMKYSIPVFQKMLLGEQHFKYYTIIQVIMQVIEQIGNFVTSRFNVFSSASGMPSSRFHKRQKAGFLWKSD